MADPFPTIGSRPHGQHRGDSWPAITACAEPGCVFRARTAVVGQSWLCPEHDDGTQLGLDPLKPLRDAVAAAIERGEEVNTLAAKEQANP